jgi:hypothetical protein
MRSTNAVIVVFDNQGGTRFINEADTGKKSGKIIQAYKYFPKHQPCGQRVVMALCLHTSVEATAVFASKNLLRKLYMIGHLIGRT